jgi:hypothetical protein
MMEHIHGRESNLWVKVQAFFYAQLQVTPSVFPYNMLGLLFGHVE